MNNLRMRQQVLVGAAGAVLAAIVIALLATLWNRVSDPDVVQLLQQLIFKAPDVPQGAIVAFELQECPKGWSPFEQGSGRFIVGVGKNSDGAEYLLPYIKGQPTHQMGGKEFVTLESMNMPAHTHNVTEEGHTHRALTTKHETKKGKVENHASSQGFPMSDAHKRFRTTDRDWYGEQYKVDASAITTAKSGVSIKNTGEGTPIDIRPPYIALHLCRKS